MKTITAVWRALIAAAPVKIWAQIGAAIALTLMVGGALALLWHGPWPSEREGQRLDAVFFLAVGLEVLMLVALAAITGLNVNVRGGKDGVSASIDQDDADPIAIKTTTETVITPSASKPVSDAEMPPWERKS